MLPVLERRCRVWLAHRRFILAPGQDPIPMFCSRKREYEITNHLGSGGMGDVYQATNSKLGRKVAIKVLPEAFACDVERVGRLEREARLLASLNHPSIAS